MKPFHPGARVPMLRGMDPWTLVMGMVAVGLATWVGLMARMLEKRPRQG